MENLAIDEIKYQCDEIEKCFNSFFYFVTNYCWIEDKETSIAIPFKLWPAQKEIIPKIVESLLLIILKARQLGLTWLIACFCLWLVRFRPLQHILVISMGEREAKEFLELRVRFILQRLPSWMFPKVVRDTSEFLEIEHIDESGARVNSLIQSLPSTPKGGQSRTPTLLVIDESCWNQYFREIYSATKPGIDAAKGQIIIISNSIKTAPGWSFTRELYTKSMKGLNSFKRIFMPWWDRPGRERKPVLDPNTNEKVPLFVLQQRQEGMDDEDIIQHYPATEHEAISTMLGSYFGRVLERHNSACPGIKGQLIKNKFKEIEFESEIRGILELWRYPYYLVDNWDGLHYTNRYGIGSDVSEGLGQTYSVAYVIDRHYDELIACLRSNRIDAYQWADLLHLLSQYYCNGLGYEPGSGNQNALICAERTGAGQTTVKRLKDLNANQYVRLVSGKRGSPVTNELGWHESQQAMHELCGDLKQWLRATQGTVYHATLIDECSTWIKAEGTMRLEPEEGHFGDCVVAAGCTIQASQSLGPCKIIERPPVGWMKKWQEESKSVWTK